MWERRVAYIVGFIIGFLVAIILLVITPLVRYQYIPTNSSLGLTYKVDRFTGKIYLIAGGGISEIQEDK